jgi:hypothetical protein
MDGDRAFALKWVASCALGTSLFGVVAYRSMWVLGEAVGRIAGELAGAALAGALLGALLALGTTLGPGLLLRPAGIRPGRWIGGSVVAAALATGTAVTLVTALSYRVEAAVSALLVGLALGLPTGIVQWQLLRGRVTSKRGMPAAVWPLVNFLAYTLGFGVVVFFSGEGDDWLTLAGMGLVVGAITALAMAGLGEKQALLVGDGGWGIKE